jgi:membrane protease subunit HflK
VADPELSLRPLAESVVRAIVGTRSFEALLTTGRHEAESAAAALLQGRAETYRLGLVITNVAFQDAHPPIAVVDAYRDVSRAESDRQRRAVEGKAYRAEALASARGQAAATLNQAEAAASVRVERASGEADAFRYLADARSAYADQTNRRIYWEFVSSILSGKPKLVLDPGQSQPRHLFFPEIPIGLRDPPALNPAVVLPKER